MSEVGMAVGLAPPGKTEYGGKGREAVAQNTTKNGKRRTTTQTKGEE